MDKDDELRQHREEFETFCYHIGFALVVWQDVEAAHFRLFVKMLGAPKQEICSIVYHSTESFEQRRVMVDRVARSFLTTRKQNATWNDLNKELKDRNADRNKFAHYALDFEPVGGQVSLGGSIKFELIAPRLRPARQNVVNRILGRTPDKEGHNLGAREVAKCIYEFQTLAKKLDAFNSTLSLPPPREGETLLQALRRTLICQMKRPRLQRNLSQKPSRHPRNSRVVSKQGIPVGRASPDRFGRARAHYILGHVVSSI